MLDTAEQNALHARVEALLIAALDRAVAAVGLSALRLETDWLWQPAVRLYLSCGFTVHLWKHALSLVRWRTDPVHRLRIDDHQAEFLLGPEGRCLIRAERDGDRLLWRAFDPIDQGKTDAPWLRPEPTLALALAVRGWPLIRSAADWERRYSWSDCGMPEGLGHKIELWEAYARHHGLPVRTPRIPGLGYPPWSQFE
jgi:hypothetical protein